MLTITQTNPETHSEDFKVLPILSALIRPDAKSAICDLDLHLSNHSKFLEYQRYMSPWK